LCKAKQSKAKKKKEKKEKKKKHAARTLKPHQVTTVKKHKNSTQSYGKAQQSPKKKARLELSKERKAPKLFSFQEKPKKSTIPITTNKHNGMQCSCCCCKMMMMMVVEEILSSKTAFGGRSFKNQTASQKLFLSLSLSLSQRFVCLSDWELTFGDGSKGRS
jgi:hypothetical protein